MRIRKFRHTGPIRTLANCRDAHLLLWVFCLACGHAARETPLLFIQKMGDAPSLDEAARKVRCQRCGKRDGMLIPSRSQMPTSPAWRR